ncbi:MULTISPECIES: acyl-CoA dehydrogenase family protein [unclassified Acinetobacter]|uniref:acyl-CoA dehydrogenase family protein n=1 Tax=unclassified Acinetobacter TaxID=196816 RepID=UPI0024484C7A|nr:MULTISPECIES: acyl-CoA dehydrogenase family protein [unclassified Acinetobacter]MDH0030231.1 acyl-CoA dehydrogenase family protein [Acinetobacter sp. GD04021]MDH0885799.1 acyl-CoA dehydrogenase family protein [Acinetobacter sp. GD03873]MDH1082419.1 acyl-CoA dehydrogenase family protein [Acinetobacter sp. GD03983]MDH2189189.1 acyl-CoA dehydrogenase family protein [Acinetobacter sp. GD03645]MDH2202377.1 acyl-CoA dehydrogenase family protein [Acinetobacter sp. GD03647]
MMNKAQGFGLSLITKIAGSEVLDQLKLRKFVEKSLYQGSKTGFKVLTKTQKAFKPQPLDKQRLPSQANKNLFDLSLTEEQQMTVDAMSQFAQEVLYTLAHDADHNAQFPEELWQHLVDLGLNYYALPEALGGVAAEQNIVSNILIAESLAKGDFSLTAGLLSTFSVINALTRWGSTQVQSMYLPVFAEDTDVTATFAFQEATPAFNPFQLKTKATENNGQITITGEKTLVVLGDTADVFLVSAEFNGQPDIFVVQCDESISIKANPAMGLKAAETATLQFNQTSALRLGDADFDYTAFVDLGNLMWCAMAIGTCEAIKAYCIKYANERTAFGEPISHRQSVAFMISDMAIEIDAMRMLVLNAASLAEAGKPFHREAYLARLLCAEKSMKMGTDGVQILGGHGFTKEHPVERWYRDLRATAILHSGLHA